MSAAALVGAPAAQAAACGGATVTATPLHSPDGTARPFYAEFRSGSTKHSGYVGYELEDTAGVLGSDVWVRLSGFAGGSLGLAANQSAGVPVRATAASGKRLAYAYLTASAETATAQTFTVEIWNGKPGLAGSAQVCTHTDGFSGVLDVLDAAANKITSVSVSTSTPAIGGSVSVTAVGDTGTMGAGDASDQVESKGVFSMSPSMEDAWPADAFTLTGVQVALGGTTYRDRLRVYPGTAAAGAYTAVYTFTVRKGTGGVTPVRPVQNIASGTQVKYTGSYSGTLQDIAAPVLTTTLVKSPAGLTGPPYLLTYQVVASNSSGGTVVLDYLRDTPTPSSAWTYVAGSARLNGAALGDPANDADTLVFQGPFTIPARSGATDGTLTFRYTLAVTATVANSVVGTVGDVSIGGSSGSTDNEVTVNPAAPAITTSDVPDGSAGTAYSTTLAATAGEAPYTWAVSAGSLPTGLALAAGGGAITGTPSAAGTFTFTIRVTDAAAQSSTRTFSATIAAPDTTAPAGASVSVDAGAAATTSTGVTLSLAATDAVGVTAYRVANGADCSAATWVTVTTTASFSGTASLTLTGGDGTRTVCAQFRDAAGNASGTVTDTIALDATAPAGTVTLAGGAAFTTSTSVSVTLEGTDAIGVTDYRVALGTDCTAAPWTAVAATGSLTATPTLTLSGGDGGKSVCAEFRDALGNVSATATDAITLDTTAPTPALATASPDPTATAFAVTVTFSEAVTGFTGADVTLANGTLSGFAGTGSSYGFTVVPGAQGAVTVDVAAAAGADAAGNQSLAATQLVRTYDSAVPAGTVSLAGGAAVTTSASVAVALGATDPAGVAAYRLAAGSDCSGATWVTVAPTTTFAQSETISLSGPDGTKTACAQYRDAAGNVSAVVTDTIVLDATAPTAALLLDGGEPSTTTATVTATAAAADALGVTGYRLSAGSDCSAATWVSVASAGAFSDAVSLVLPDGDGAKTACAQFRDAAGNVSAVALATIELVTPAHVVAPVPPAEAAPAAITILTDPPAVVASTSMTIRFAVDDRTASSRCRLDGGAFAPCSGTVSYTGLAPGPHTVVVEVTDAAGNVTSRTVGWRVATTAAADVKVAITSTATTVERGQVFRTTATARNVGDATATGVVLTVTLPADVEFVSGEARHVAAAAARRLQGRRAAFPCSVADRLVSCAVGVLEPEARYVVVLTLRALRTGGLDVVARTNASNSGPASAGLHSAAPRSSVTLGLEARTSRPYNHVRRGEAFTATATLRNVGRGRADAARITVLLPRGLRLVDGGGCAVRGSRLTCAVGALPRGARHVVRLKLRAASSGTLSLGAFATTATQPRVAARVVVRAPNARRCTIYGTTRVVRGTPGDDIICLSPGFHLVLAGTGDDVVYGRSGRQVIYGGAGPDVLYGAADDDYLDGGPGRDLLEGGTGSDKLLGRRGDDRLRGGVGRDRLHGGRGADVALGGTGDIVFEIEGGAQAGWRTGASGGIQSIVKRGVR